MSNAVLVERNTAVAMGSPTPLLLVGIHHVGPLKNAVFQRDRQAKLARTPIKAFVS